jgi:hypothetical protein
MTGLGSQAFLGIQALAPLLNGIRTAFGHGDFMELLGALHILGNSYRLASMGAGSTMLYGRFTAGFCRTIVASLCHRRCGGLDGIAGHESLAGQLIAIFE